MKRNKFNWRLNNQIKAEKLRVIGPDGNQIGVIKLKEALKKAIDLELDLIEIAPKAKPPVARIVDLGKFKYEEEKKLKKAKKGNKKKDVKEIRFSPFIAEADFNTRIEKINEFLEEGNKIRIVVKFKGRQMNSKDFGYKLTDKIIKLYEDRINLDMKPKFIGRHLTCVISPMSKTKLKKKDEKKDKETKNQKDTSKKV